MTITIYPTNSEAVCKDLTLYMLICFNMNMSLVKFESSAITFIHKNAFENVICKMAAIWLRGLCIIYALAEWSLSMFQLGVSELIRVEKSYLKWVRVKDI